MTVLVYVKTLLHYYCIVLHSWYVCLDIKLSFLYIFSENQENLEHCCDILRNDLKLIFTMEGIIAFLFQTAYSRSTSCIDYRREIPSWHLRRTVNSRTWYGHYLNPCDNWPVVTLTQVMGGDIQETFEFCPVTHTIISFHRDTEYLRWFLNNLR